MSLTLPDCQCAMISLSQASPFNLKFGSTKQLCPRHEGAAPPPTQGVCVCVKYTSTVTATEQRLACCSEFRIGSRAGGRRTQSREENRPGGAAAAAAAAAADSVIIESS